MKNKYEIEYAYGGRYKGEITHKVIVESDDRKEALELFEKKYHYEVIISCKELDQ